MYDHTDKFGEQCPGAGQPPLEQTTFGLSK
jgi:hypothetical protein